MEELLNFDAPFNVGLMDQAVHSFYSQGSLDAQQVLVKFQSHPQAWSRFADILDRSQNENTKILALGILESTIRFRWKTLQQIDRDNLRLYAINFINAACVDPNSRTAHSVLIRKMNLVLVQILKHEWPHNWADFMPSLINWSGGNESICINSMEILSLLSEEIFDFGAEQMTQEKKRMIQQNFNKEFGNIFMFFHSVLNSSTNQDLIASSLRTLLRFLKWVPVFYVFENNLIELLATKFFIASPLQNQSLKCLTEIASIELSPYEKAGEYSAKIVQMYSFVISHIKNNIITGDIDLVSVYNTGGADAQAFLRFLSNFITSSLKVHIELLQSSNAMNSLLQSLDFLLRISLVDDPVIFKICTDYWALFVNQLYSFSVDGAGQSQLDLILGSGAMSSRPTDPRFRPYEPLLSQLRVVIISKMAKPEEVIIVEGEDGDIVRETFKDTDVLILYKTLKESLVYLTHLDPQDTQNIMMQKLSAQMDGSEWSWNNLNTLCWAIGSISGALNEQSEKRFLVNVIRDLLNLCEQRRGKNNKAVIASNIMYVVGQYPRFLKKHWRFLKTVVNKLFEFMHETFEGVQEMACDTFHKIASCCRGKFTQVQENEIIPFVEEILDNLPDIISDLQQGHIARFYEAMGLILRAESQPDRRQGLVLRLMDMPNQSWTRFVADASHNPHLIQDLHVLRQVRYVLRLNREVATSLGEGFIVQISRLYVELLKSYQLFASFINETLKSQGLRASETSMIREARKVKGEMLCLLEAFLSNGAQPHKQFVISEFMPALLEIVLQDYMHSPEVTRDARVLTLFATSIDQLGEPMAHLVPRIFETVFPSTIDMITKNFEDFPDHRINFFTLVRAINSKCFQCFFMIDENQFQIVYNSIVWAARHLERNVSDTGLQTLVELLDNVERANLVVQFHQKYFLLVLQDTLAVLTDSLHKSGFHLQCIILQKLFLLVNSGQLTSPLFNINEHGTFPSNQAFVAQYVRNAVSTVFNHVSSQHIESFVAGMFQVCQEERQFKFHIRDFLINLKEFSVDDSDVSLGGPDVSSKGMAATDQRGASVPGLS